MLRSTSLSLLLLGLVSTSAFSVDASTDSTSTNLQSTEESVPNEVVTTSEGTKGPATHRLWMISTGIQRFRMIGDNDHEMHGLAGHVGFGVSYFYRPNLMLQGSIETVIGPWEKMRNNSFEGDYSGTSFTADMIYAPFDDSLRSNSLVFAGALSATYFDMNGRTVGRNLREKSIPNHPDNLYLENSYRVKLNGVWLTPGIVMAHIKSPRPTGNTVDLLTTRIEGTSLRVGLGLPLFARYRSSFMRRRYGDEATDPPQELKEKGQMAGFSVYASVQTWLGT
jgi:hypothetical protein